MQHKPGTESEERSLSTEADPWRGLENALRERDERFSKTFNLAPIAMSISTLDEGRYVDVNEALLETTGYNRAEMIGRTARELNIFSDPGDAVRIRELLGTTRPVKGIELGLRGKHGDVRTFLLAADIIELNDMPCLLTASVDITDRKGNEAALQFLDSLSRATADIADADAILAVTTSMLGQHLKAAVCAYADVDDDGDSFTIRGNWSAPSTLGIVGRYRLNAFGQLAATKLRSGMPLVLDDIRKQLPAEEAATFLGLGLAATICMPQIKNGRLAALMAIHDAKPRIWLSRDLATLREVTDRSWTHIERAKLLQELRDSEARYRGAVVTGRIAAWETDLVARTRTWTQEGMALFGLNLPEGRGVVGGDADEFFHSLHPDDRHQVAEFHHRANSEDTFPVEYRIVSSDGAIRWVSGRGRVVSRAADGKAHRMLNIVVDVTERKEAEDHVQLLMRELAHRSKNLLAIVQSIAGQTGRTSKDLAEFQRAFSQRLQGLAASHDLLTQQDWRGVGLSELVDGQLALFTAGQNRLLSVGGPPAMLTSQIAQALGLALHELGTNAIKHGAWSTPAGKIELSWEFSPDRKMLRMRWRERGGPAVFPPTRKGFGHVVIKDMVAQAVDGVVSMEFEPAGLEWSLSLPTTHLLS